uniref:hypothetical protein n=1 Tax=uncultured Acidovorax sp. TaxID=158751 RepID=UPI0030F8E01F
FQIPNEKNASQLLTDWHCGDGAFLWAMQNGYNAINYIAACAYFIRLFRLKTLKALQIKRNQLSFS